MTPLAQDIVVAAIVVAASGYATVRFMPKTWRSGLAATAAAWVVRSGFSDVAARRVEAKLSSGGACGSCDSCRACATPAAPTVATQQPIARVIPIARARR